MSTRLARRTTLSIPLVVAMGSACAPPSTKTPAPTEAPDPTPKAPTTDDGWSPAWEVTGLATPESVLYDAEREVLYVSNIDGEGGDRDGKGFISRLSLDGKVLDLQWVGGLDAPKGMALWGGDLYVTDLTTLVRIDIETGTVASRDTVDGAEFLNDLAAGPDGTLYVSDSRTMAIFRRRPGGTVESWLRGPELTHPNGVFMLDDATLLVGEPGKILAVDVASGAISVLLEGVGSVEVTDGLVPDGHGGFFTSDWHGGVWRTSPEGSTLLMNTRDQKINAADLEYVAARRLLLIPTFFDDRVRAFVVKD